MARVFKHSRSTGAARLVLLALADEAHSSGAVTAYARSQSHLARKANCDERTVRRAIHDLEAIGELQVLAHGDGHNQSDYMLTIEDRPPDPEPDEMSATPSGGGRDARPARTHRPPREGEMPAPSSRSSRLPPPPERSAPKSHGNGSESGGGGDDRIDKAARVLGRLDHEREQAKGTAIRDHGAFRASLVKRWRESEDLAHLARTYPNATVVELVDLAGEPVSVHPAMRKRPDCGRCDGFGVYDVGDGTFTFCEHEERSA